MREDIDNLINSKLDELESNNSDNKDVIKLVNEQNNKVEKEKKEKLLLELDRIKQIGVDIEYNENMSIKELEDIIEGVRF